MALPNPSKELAVSIEAGVTWLKGAAVFGYEYTGGRVVEGGRQLKPKDGAGPILVAVLQHPAAEADLWRSRQDAATTTCERNLARKAQWLRVVQQRRGAEDDRRLCGLVQDERSLCRRSSDAADATGIESFRLAALYWTAWSHSFDIGPVAVGRGPTLSPLRVPAVLESETHARGLADAIQRIAADLHIPYIFKASYDKANRTSIRSFRGPGLGRGRADVAGDRPGRRSARADRRAHAGGLLCDCRGRWADMWRRYCRFRRSSAGRRIC